LWPPPDRARVWAAWGRGRAVGPGRGEAARALRSDVPGPLINPCTDVRRWTARRTMPMPVGERTRGMSPLAEKGSRARTSVLATLPHPWRALFVSQRVGWACRLRASGGHMCMDARSGPGCAVRKAPSRLSAPRTHCTPSHARCPHTCSSWRRPESCRRNDRAARRKASSVHARVPSARPQSASLSPFARNRGMSPLVPLADGLRGQAVDQAGCQQLQPHA